MKKKAHSLRQMFIASKGIFTFFVVILLSTSILQSQCPSSLILYSQDDVDNFPINYPNCTHLDGKVEIYGDDITNLDGLSQLQSIGGHLDILGNNNLISIEGLSNVTHVGNFIQIMSNPSLVSLLGLNNLDSCNMMLVIHGNHTLTDLNGLESLVYVDAIEIFDNTSLTNLNGLENLTTINGSFSIGSNPVLGALSDFHNLNYIKMGLSISGSDSLRNLNGFEALDSIGGHFGLSYNPILSNLEALDNLSKVGGILTLSHNYNLENLYGMEGLKTIGSDLRIHNCTSLSTLIGLDSLTSVGGDLQIYENNSLHTLSGIDNIEAESIMNLSITYNPQLSTCAVQSVCDYLANPNGDIQIYVNATGCNNSVEVTEACTVGIPETSSDAKLSIYPNPFTTSTAIEFELKRISNIQFTVYNLQAVVVYEWEEQQAQPGSHKVTWSPSHLPVGVYFALLRSEDGVSVVKMIKQ